MCNKNILRGWVTTVGEVLSVLSEVRNRGEEVKWSEKGEKSDLRSSSLATTCRVSGWVCIVTSAAIEVNAFNSLPQQVMRFGCLCDNHNRSLCKYDNKSTELGKVEYTLWFWRSYRLIVLCGSKQIVPGRFREQVLAFERRISISLARDNLTTACLLYSNKKASSRKRENYDKTLESNRVIKCNKCCYISHRSGSSTFHYAFSTEWPAVCENGDLPCPFPERLTFLVWESEWEKIKSHLNCK